jgi:DNA-binding response OmpR family regulator
MAQNPTAPLILVVEDDAGLRLLIDLFLQEDGYRVVTANDGGIGAEILRTGRVDLLITDLVMPVQDGYRLAELARTLKVPAILVSGHPDAMQRVENTDFPRLDKPFRLEELARLVSQQLQAGR